LPRNMKTGAKAERDTLRHEMLIAGCSHDLIAQEMERRWSFRPREAYRHAHGWSQDEVAARFTEVADRLGSERAAQAPMIGTRIGEYERWPHGGRRPSAYVITVLGLVFGTTMDRLLDYDDYRHFPDQDRTVIAAMLAGAGASGGNGAVHGKPAPSDAMPRQPGSAPFVAALVGDEHSGPTPGGPAPTPSTSDDLVAAQAAALQAVLEASILDASGPEIPSADPSTADAAAPYGTDAPADTSALLTPATVADPAATAATPVPATLQAPATTARLVQRVLSARAAAAGLAGADHLVLAPAPGSSMLRQRRRDELLDNYSGSPPDLEEMIMAASAGQSAEFAEWAEATNVGPTTMEQFEQDIRGIAKSYLSSPPLPVVLTTLRVRNRLFALLEGRQYPNQARQLYLLAGRVCGLLAWMSSDLGRHMEAETQARTGWLCAELAEHDGLRAWIRATQSKLAYWDNRIRESAQLAEHGLRYVSPDTAPVLLASLAARAWARLGQADSAHTALASAAEHREHAGEDEVGGLYGFSLAQQRYLAGTTHLYLQEPENALREAEEAVALFEGGRADERFYGAEILALIDAATAHLQAGALDGAADKLRPVLALQPQQRLATFTLRLGDMRDALRRSRYATSTEAIEMQHQITDFQSEALGQLVGARP
jgi:transcriptional regulator with XRE-family HTH domain/tetratricopeptide (TPR) repeat protein